MAEYSEVIPTRPGFYVYRMFNADGICLRVGRIGDNGPRRPSERFNEYRNDSRYPWYPEVERTDIATLADHSEIIAEEGRQIGELHPIYNKIGALLPICSNGHDLTGPNSRRPDGCCRECNRERERKPEFKRAHAARERKRGKKPEVKARRAASCRRYRARRRWGPAPGQEGLF